jgi:hypothetical protein
MYGRTGGSNPNLALNSTLKASVERKSIPLPHAPVRFSRFMCADLELPHCTCLGKLMAFDGISILPTCWATHRAITLAVLTSQSHHVPSRWPLLKGRKPDEPFDRNLCD